MTLMMSMRVVHLDTFIRSDGPVESFAHPVTLLILMMSISVVPLDSQIHSDGQV